MTLAAAAATADTPAPPRRCAADAAPAGSGQHRCCRISSRSGAICATRRCAEKSGQVVRHAGPGQDRAPATRPGRCWPPASSITSGLRAPHAFASPLWTTLFSMPASSRRRSRSAPSWAMPLAMPASSPTCWPQPARRVGEARQRPRRGAEVQRAQQRRAATQCKRRRCVQRGRSPAARRGRCGTTPGRRCRPARQRDVQPMPITSQRSCALSHRPAASTSIRRPPSLRSWPRSHRVIGPFSGRDARPPDPAPRPASGRPPATARSSRPAPAWASEKVSALPGAASDHQERPSRARRLALGQQQAGLGESPAAALEQRGAGRAGLGQDLDAQPGASGSSVCHSVSGSQCSGRFMRMSGGSGANGSALGFSASGRASYRGTSAIRSGRRRLSSVSGCGGHRSRAGSRRTALAGGDVAQRAMNTRPACSSLSQLGSQAWLIQRAELPPTPPSMTRPSLEVGSKGMVRVGRIARMASQGPRPSRSPRRRIPG